MDGVFRLLSPALDQLLEDAGPRQSVVLLDALKVLCLEDFLSLSIIGASAACPGCRTHLTHRIHRAELSSQSDQRTIIHVEFKSILLWSYVRPALIRSAVAIERGKILCAPEGCVALATTGLIVQEVLPVVLSAVEQLADVSSRDLLLGLLQ